MDKTYNILVSGVGAIIGYGIIKSLKKCTISTKIIGMDIYNDAVGKYQCDKFIQAVHSSAENYITFIKDVIEHEQIDIVFFGTEQEIFRCATNKKDLGEIYSKFVINNEPILSLANDKWKIQQYLIDNGLQKYVIPSVIDGCYNDLVERFGTKIILKPRTSYASKGIQVVDSVEAYNFYKTQMGNSFMAQKIVGDSENEYTVACFGFGNGSSSTNITLKRTLSQEGATAKAQYVDNREINVAVKELCRLLKPIGPTNFQFRFDKDKLYLLEINPRISSSTSIRASMGYNEAEMCINYFLKNEWYDPDIKGGYAVRYIDELTFS